MKITDRDGLKAKTDIVADGVTLFKEGVTYTVLPMSGSDDFCIRAMNEDIAEFDPSMGKILCDVRQEDGLINHIPAQFARANFTIVRGCRY